MNWNTLCSRTVKAIERTATDGCVEQGEQAGIEINHDTEFRNEYTRNLLPSRFSWLAKLELQILLFGGTKSSFPRANGASPSRLHAHTQTIPSHLPVIPLSPE